MAEGSWVRTGDLVIDDVGRIHIAYTADDRSIMYTLSKDAGDTWNQPVAIYVEERSEFAVVGPKLAVDRDENVSVCWTKTSEATSWGPIGAEFSHSSGSSDTWSPPMALAEGEGFGSCALLADSHGRLHAMWVGSLTAGGRYHRMSIDGGDSWTSAIVVASPEDIKGLGGAPNLLEDSAGVVHAIFPGRGSVGEQIWYANWSHDRWSTPIPVMTGLVHLEKSAATLQDGHRIHVMALEYQSLDYWHALADTGAPIKRDVVLPTPTFSVTSTRPTDQIKPTSSLDGATAVAASPRNAEVAAGEARAHRAPDSMVWLIALAPAILLVSAVVVFRMLRRR